MKKSIFLSQNLWKGLVFWVILQLIYLLSVEIAKHPFSLTVTDYLMFFGGLLLAFLLSIWAIWQAFQKPFLVLIPLLLFAFYYIDATSELFSVDLAFMLQKSRYEQILERHLNNTTLQMREQPKTLSFVEYKGQKSLVVEIELSGLLDGWFSLVYYKSDIKLSPKQLVERFFPSPMEGECRQLQEFWHYCHLGV